MSTALVYHGTAHAVAPEIRRHGLRPAQGRSHVYVKGGMSSMSTANRTDGGRAIVGTCRTCRTETGWMKSPDHFDGGERAWARYKALLSVALRVDCGILQLTHPGNEALFDALLQAEILTVDAVEETIEDGSILAVPGIGPKRAEWLREAVRRYHDAPGLSR
jgi:hypothetical protein